ncbi:glycosyltransferase family 4 protein [Klebsiella pneumoniae]|nr:glycosyltransferase family 4 protein [Klebsiella quasipneumoniae subsp. quasipneumoniae]
MIYINGRFLTQKITGVQRFAFELSSRLSQIRKDVVFLVPDLSLINPEYSTHSMKIIEVKGGGGHYWEQITLPQFLKKNGKPLIISLCNTGPAFYRNHIATSHDITYVRYPNGFPKKFRYFYRVITPLIIKNAQAILTVSNFSKEEISSHYNCNKNKINVIYNAVNSSFKKNYSNSTVAESYFLAVSSVNFHKNLHGLVNAFSESDLDVKLKIIGGTTKFFSDVDINVDDPRISFLGRVDDEALIQLYQNAQAFIFPSLYEGFGIPPLEAQSCGCPVLSSDRASMREVLASSALYFNPDSKKEIIDSMNLIYSNDALRESLINKGIENVARFSWAESANKLNLLVDRIANE